MAKAQKRGNKEAKKPKKVKEPVAAATSLLTRGVAIGAAAPKGKKG